MKAIMNVHAVLPCKERPHEGSGLATGAQTVEDRASRVGEGEQWLRRERWPPGAGFGHWFCRRLAKGMQGNLCHPSECRPLV